MINRDTRILLTGGTGFFGVSLLNYYASLSSPPNVLVLSRNPDSFLRKNEKFSNLDWLGFYKGDILKPATFPHKHDFTHAIHAAADSTLGPRLSPLQRADQIITGTRNVLDFSVSKKIKRFLLTSSGGVYGPRSHPTGFREDDLTLPDVTDINNAYSFGKIFAEHLAMIYYNQYGIETVIARCFSFIGPDLPLNVHFAAGNFIFDAIASEKITIKGNGLPIRSYMYQSDLAYWLSILLEQGKAGRIYNVGSDAPLTLKELAFKIRKIICPDKEIVIQSCASGSENRSCYYPSIYRAESELGLTINITIDESIKLTVQELKRRMSFEPA